MKNFDTVIRFFGHSSYPFSSDLYKNLSDYHHTVTNKDYIEIDNTIRRNRRLQEHDHDSHDSGQTVSSGDASKSHQSINDVYAKSDLVDKSLYTPDLISRHWPEVGTFGETSICRCPNGQMYYAGKYDWTFFPELYACEGGVIENYHRFTDFSGQGIKVKCGHLKTEDEINCNDYRMAANVCGEVPNDGIDPGNGYCPEMYQRLYCPMGFKCMKLKDINNDNR